ncbi:MAG: UvrD-helicase domain-containing protein [Desulfobacteraceae bacterium]|nr:UvrD-helicase domain-containing protein [Desulfobacteraceae bacterium]MBC2755537.1 UvrD-helicase domain-containing protein [Desulfobacteraceae bacterium]
MKFIADLHIHSRFSRATAKSLDFENLYMAARLKGITVVGTGDFTHPGWIAEISEKLVPAEPGLFKLKDELEAACEKQLPFTDKAPVRFLLSCEISSIYKKSGATRKNHNLVFLPDIASATRFNARLDQIGNIKSDGRPILGLDAKNLLEILLETSDDGFLIPAHIWTPWFSLFGSKSGFDTIEECFEDLTPHIFAVETGLSSDPPMNWRVGNIDGITLVSNSDAHSPANLGREANLFDTDLSYPAIRDTLKSGDANRFLGTIEFFPEEGKYHHDGHRKCEVNITPNKSIKYNDLCPVCGKPMTLGVLHRVEELATRKEGEKPEKTHPYYSVIPLAEIISEIVGMGPKTKKVAYHYNKAIKTLGPELNILHRMAIEKIATAPVPFLGEAIRRMREGLVHITPGYDGEYGRIKVLNPEEKDRLTGQKSLFQIPKKNGPPPKKGTKAPRQSSDKQTAAPSNQKDKQKETGKTQTAETDKESDILAGLNDDQLKAVTYETGPLLIVAGPGTGKTRTLTCRIAHLIKNRGVNPENILAVTFTNKAAAEMAARLSGMLGQKTPLPLTATFHAFCFKLLKEIHHNRSKDHAVIDDFDRKELVAEAIHSVKKYIIDLNIKTDIAVDRIVCAKQHLLAPSDDLESVTDGLNTKDFAAVYEVYQHLLDGQYLYDYEDLIFKTVSFFESDMESKNFYKTRFPYIFVDEYQDLNFGQYNIIKALAPVDGNICVIGDPDQSIYGFRGADVSFFQRFTDDFPSAQKIRLTRNYRSSETILAASHQIIQKHSLNDFTRRVYSGITGLKAISIIETESEKSEAVAVGKTIEQMVGGTGFHFDDFNTNPDALHGEYRAFSDFAVLYRTSAQGKIFAEVLGSAGIPCQTASKENAFCKKGIIELLSLLKIIEGYGAYIDFERVNAVIDHGIEKQDLEALKTWGYNNRYPLSGLMAEAERLEIDNLTKPGRRRLDVMLKFIAGYARHISGLSVKDKLVYLAKQARNANRLKSDTKSREAFDHVVRVAETFGENASGFLETAALQSDPDVFDTKSQKVSLMTIHAAKGLEFPIVFIAGCENGLIPFIRQGAALCDMDEERRLFYVAMTRAKDHLFFTRTKKRTIYGKTDTRDISPFVADIENKLLKNEIQPPIKKKKGPVQMTLF